MPNIRVDPVTLAVRSGLYHQPSRRTTPPIGKSTLGFIDPNTGQVSDPGDPNVFNDPNDPINATRESIDFFGRVAHAIESFFGIGSGRTEADVIVPIQNDLMVALGGITQRILIGRNPSLDELLQMFVQVKQYAAYFIKYVSDQRFFDGRASAQALDTVMPYIDGSCGYQPRTWNQDGLLFPTIPDCGFTWGDGTIAGPGTNGMLGALRRAIEERGGSVVARLPLVSSSTTPTGTSLPLIAPSTSFMGLSTPMLIAIGAIVILAWSKR